MERQEQKELARRRRNDVQNCRNYARRWLKNEWHMSGDDLERQAVKRERTATPCSCFMCGNQRKNDCEFNGRTFQEKKFFDSMEEQYREVR